MSYGTCKKCRCTDNHACLSDIHGSCWWVDETHEICSFCEEPFVSDHSIERPSDFQDEPHRDYDILDLQKLPTADLNHLAYGFGIDPEIKSKQGKIYAILNKQNGL